MKTRLLTHVFILLIAALLFNGSALAQNRHGKESFFGGPPTAEEKVARLSEVLGLSDQQSVDLLIVLQEKEGKRQALREETVMLMGPEICALMDETETEILAILTADQAEQFQQMKEDRRTRAEGKGHHQGRGFGPPDCSQFEDSDG